MSSPTSNQSAARRFFAAVTLGAAALMSGAPKQVVAQSAQAAALPAGDGREIVAVACTQCHGPGAFMQLRQGPDAWRAQVYDMVLRGAQVRPDEMERVVAYLASQFGAGINVPPPLAQVRLPEGPDRALVEQKCSICHGLDRVVAARRSGREWDAVVARMVVLGAPAAGDDGRKISAYLRDNFGPRQMTTQR